MTKTNFLNDEFNEDGEEEADFIDEIDDFLNNEHDIADGEDDGYEGEEDGGGEYSDKDEDGDSEDTVTINKSKVVLVKKLLENMKENNEKLSQLLSGCISAKDEERISIGQMSDDTFSDNNKDGDRAGEGRIVEGVFDGENMIGPDGKQYSVPANYASKSKLIEGDILKLTITPSGTFVYKQIGPIERSRVIGKLEQNDTGSFIVISEGKKWRVLTASVTYYKGKSGDEVVILVPKAGQSQWAAVDNIVRSKF